MQNEDYEEAARIKKLVKKEEAKASANNDDVTHEAPPGEDRDDDVDVDGETEHAEDSRDPREHGVDQSTAERVHKSWQNEGETAHDMFL